MKTYMMMKRNFNSKIIQKRLKIKCKLNKNLKICTVKSLKEKKIYKQLNNKIKMKNALLCQKFIPISTIIK